MHDTVLFHALNVLSNLACLVRYMCIDDVERLTRFC